KEGDILKIVVMGSALNNTGSLQAIYWRTTFNGVNWDLPASNYGSHANGLDWVFEQELICISAGATGTVEVTRRLYTAQQKPDPEQEGFINTDSITLDTTIAQAFTLIAALGTA